MKKHDYLQVRLTPALKAEVEAAAESLDIPVVLFMQKAAEYLVAHVKRGEAVELRPVAPAVAAPVEAQEEASNV